LSAPSRPAVAVLGVTSAIARATANAFAEAGHSLVVCARDEAELERIASDIRVRYGVEVHTVSFDAGTQSTTESLCERCIDKAGTLAGVVLGFGFMAEQAEGQANPGVIRQTMDANLTEAAVILERFAAHFEEQGTGFIAGIASVAGDRGRQSNYIYGASKAGFATYLQGLRNRLDKQGVRVLTVKPGFVDTKMTWGLPGLFLVASPESVGRTIHRAVQRGKDVIYVPWFWRYILLIIRAIPERVFKRLSL
jgi:short-subunit dehydrogenase